MTPTLTTAEQCRIRDVPASCSCTGWMYRTQPARWVLPYPDSGCPWHTVRGAR